jgi:site-specific DNA-methyltransferase (adenine-specific)
LKVSLAKLDPPFNSNATYYVLFQEHHDTPAPSQIEAFEDTWEWDLAASETFQNVVEQGERPLGRLDDDLAVSDPG